MWYYPTNYFSNFGNQPQQQMMPQQMGMQPQQSAMLRGRVVTSLEEVKASPVIMDGIETYFPLPAENAIYIKYVDLNGNSVIKKYVQIQQEDNQEQQQPLTTAITDLQNRVKSLETVLNDLSTPAPKKGGGAWQ